jgi:phosphoribosylanthranilate isomerase
VEGDGGGDGWPGRVGRPRGGRSVSGAHVSRAGAPAVKVCCIQDEEELRLAADAGARFVGLVGAMPSGPGPIPDEAIAHVAARAPHDVTTVLLTSRTEAPQIVAHVRATGVRAVQIVRDVPVDTRRAVRASLPGVAILQVVHVEGPSAVDCARRAAQGADYLLLDSGRPGARVAELGGTGRTHDWSLSARIVEESRVPVLLAGGLRPDNVAAAVAAVRPWGVDVCSGLRDPRGRLDAGRLRAFMEGVRGGA